MRTLHRAGLHSLLAVFLAAGPAAAGLFDSWENTCTLGITGYGRDTALTNFPLLVQLGTSTVPGFAYSQFTAPTSGDDLRFASADGATELAYEIEKWDTAGVSYVWVRIPEVVGTVTAVRAHWGYPTGAPSYSAVGGAWDTNYLGVWHMAQTNAQDATTNGFNGQAKGSVTAVNAGAVAGACDFDADVDYIEIPDSPRLTLSGSYTVSAWIRPDALGDYAAFVGTYNNNGFIFTVYNDAANTLHFWAGGQWRSSYTTIPDGEWRYVTYTRSGTTGTFYIAGQKAWSTNNAVAGTDGGNLHIGGGGTGWSSYRYDGLVDEVRISRIDRSSNWVWASWMAIQSNAQFVSYGPGTPNSTDLAVRALPPWPLGATSATMNGRLLGTGDAENPELAFCWGPADAGTAATSDWPNVLSLGAGYSTGAIFQAGLSGLDSGGSYAYRTFATNSAGAAWSTNAVSFQTVYTPSVSTAGPSDVKWTSAVLNGEVTDAGIEAPVVTVFYWVTGAAVTSSVTMGIQTGAFSAAVAYLLPASSYEFQFAAANAAGTGWSDPGSFETLTPHYLSTNGGSVSPYTNWTDAATNLFNVLAVATNDGDAIVVSNGTYILHTDARLTNAVTLVSVAGATGTWISIDSSVALRTNRIFTIQNTGAVVDGFTLSGHLIPGYPGYYMYGGAVNMSSGTVRNCIIGPNTNGSYGAGLYMTGGQVINTVFRNNSVTHQNSAYGGGLNIQSGLASNCLFYGNAATDAGGGVYMNGGRVIDCIITNNTYGGGNVGGGGAMVAAGQVANCLIAKNRDLHATQYRGAGLRISGGSAVNCTIVENRWQNGDTASGVYMAGGALTNCIVFFNGATYPALGQENIWSNAGSIVYTLSQPLPSGTGNASTAPDFVDRSNMNYRLGFGSSGVDAGTTVAGLDHDLERTIRPLDGDLSGTAEPDMGCYERNPGGGAFVCTFEATPVEGIDSLQSVFTATVTGPGTGTVFYAWDFDNNGTADASGYDKRSVTNTFPAGTYSVTLTCTNDLYDTATKTKAGYILVWPSVAYVATNGNNTAPYDSWAKAASNIQAAVDAVYSTGTVYVGDGVYTLASKIIISKGIRLLSMSGYGATTIRSPGGVKIMEIQNNSTLVDGFKMTGINLGYPNSGTINMTGGEVRNCLITGNNLGTEGAGIHMTGGFVHDCIITNNFAQHQNTGYGGALWLSGGVVSNCDLSNNRCLDGAGSVYCSGGVVKNCILTNCFSTFAAASGGGAIVTGSGRLENCLIAGNRLTSLSGTGVGAGVYQTGGALVNCTVADNTRAVAASQSGLSITAGAVTNCIFYYNSSVFPATSGENIYQTGGTIAYSCMQPAVSGEGNTPDAPLFANRLTNDYHLSTGSSCIDAGTNLALSTDLDGLSRPTDGNGDAVTNVDIGCYEFPESVAAFACTFSAAPLVGTNTLETVFSASVSGPGTSSVIYCWDFDNDGTNDASGPGLALVTNTYLEPGLYSVALTCTNALSETATQARIAYLRVYSPVAYVATNGGNLFPYHTWDRAAVSLGDAYDAVVEGGTIHVTNGTHTVAATISVQKSVTIRSVNGATTTTLRSTGPEVFLVATNAFLLDGFTLTGAVLPYGHYGIVTLNNGGTVRNCIFRGNSIGSCGGIYVNGGGLVEDCVITNNVAGHQNTGLGGGARMVNGTIRNCLIAYNGANDGGGGVYMSGGTLEDCTLAFNYRSGGNTGYGGGLWVAGGLVQNCFILTNRAVGSTTGGGGGAYMTGGRLRTCLVAGNTTTNEGAGAYLAGASAVLENVTVARNMAFGGTIGGVYMSAGSATNCIVYTNAAAGVTGDANAGGPSPAFRYSCAPTLTPGVDGNVNGDPRFEDPASDLYGIGIGSPCFDSGAMAAWMAGASDLAGMPRLVHGRVDMGAYEMLPPRGSLFWVH